ncbi:MAG: 2,3-bisphosphoglycerate-independent phosphoglycerate mutase [Candidatus Pacebacteria bacterium]|nr:2,3-bisphosphoglycerate-independent phosphoglycerate mutase [Candidatus Paceibacterota bacterium]
MPNDKKNQTRPKPVMLIILDGWGLGQKNAGNTLSNAKLPTFEKLDEYYPHVALQASGISVGLPWGEPGNSEVGHMTLGAGKVIYQNMPRITMAIQNGEFYNNEVFLKTIENAKKRDQAIHLMGLVGRGGVHSSLDHLYALLELMSNQKMRKVYLHVFTDGRDSSPTSGAEVLKELQIKMQKFQVGKIATVCGRYFAMDRNNNWDRTKKAYDAIVRGTGNQIKDPEKYLRDSYKKEVTDEYMEPAVVCEGDASDKLTPIAQVKDGDSVIFFNYREDRARQLTKAFVVPGFNKFPIETFKDLFFTTMTQYEDNLPVEVAFPPIEIKDCLSKVLSGRKLTQLRIAETEKFAHVTYFFNGGNEEPYPLEDRVIIPSKDVATYDLAPEMSASEITEKVLQNIERNKYDFILLNFANADMVGHTGNEEAAITAVEFVDRCMEQIIKAVLSSGGQLLITADHGNVEEMIDPRTGEKDTEHSANPVPLWYVTPSNHRGKAGEEIPAEIAGLLSDIAPTILDIMHIEKPDDMTGESLLPVLKS